MTCVIGWDLGGANLKLARAEGGRTTHVAQVPCPARQDSSKFDAALDEALKLAGKIAEHSRPAVMMAKEAVNRAFETTLAEGVRFERRVFHSLFATDDQKEGMAAFVEKRPAQFKNR